MTRIVFLGPPGGGKGTQAARIAAALRVPHVSTGEMLRAAAASGTPLGRTVKSTLDAGQFVSDDVMAGVVRERLLQEDCRRGFLLDGYPRTLEQGRFLDGLLKDAGSALTHVALLDVPREELIGRIQRRSRGADDRLDVVLRRLEDYETKTAPLVPYYEARGLLRRVDGLGSVDEVFTRLADAVGAARP
jgi:adenylate kinase